VTVHTTLSNTVWNSRQSIRFSLPSTTWSLGRSQKFRLDFISGLSRWKSTCRPHLQYLEHPPPRNGECLFVATTKLVMARTVHRLAHHRSGPGVFCAIEIDASLLSFIAQLFRPIERFFLSENAFWRSFYFRLDRTELQCDLEG